MPSSLPIKAETPKKATSGKRKASDKDRYERFRQAAREFGTNESEEPSIRLQILPFNYKFRRVSSWHCDPCGPPDKVRDGVEEWRAAGVSTPILVPNSVAGNQITALEELLAAFS
jgi:hypothetical protein